MSRRPLRAVVLSLSYPPDTGGGGVQLSQLVERLARLGVAVTVLAPSSSAALASTSERTATPGLGVERLRAPEGGAARGRALGFRAASWLLRNPGWDVLHVSGFFPSVAPAVAVARLLGRPVLVKVTELPPGETFRGGPSLLRRAAFAVLRGADRIVAISDAIAVTLAAAGVPEARIARIPNGVDTERFRPAEGDERARLRGGLSWPAEGLVLLCCGVLSRRKNAVAIVRALARARIDEATLVLAGPEHPDPDYQRELEAAVSVLPPGLGVVWSGALDAEALPQAMRAADLLVHTSRFEGLPNVLLEALASGVPCVASEIPGSADVLEGGGGLLVPSEDDEVLATTLAQLAADPARRRALGAEGRRLSQERYSLEAVAESYRDLYDELVRAER
jgi:glycosyltransferase involved in cell wall biosynthesis